MKWPEAIRFNAPLRDVRICLRGEGSQTSDEEWECHLAEREKLAYERGRMEGEKALGEQLLRQRTELMEVHQGVIQSLRQAVPDILQKLESDLVVLAVETARKLVAGMPISAEMVEGAIREATAQVQEATEFNVYLHPDDLALLRQIDSPLLRPASGSDTIHFHASQEVTRGGCQVQTRFGIIDATRETKIEQVHKALGL